MSSLSARHVRHRRARTGPRDRGASLVEIVVSIVLLGTAGISMLTALRVTVSGTRTDLDRAEAVVWLQSAAGELEKAERIGCAAGATAVRAGYLDHVRAETAPPSGWTADRLTIIGDVLAWDGASYRDPDDLGGACFDEAGFRLQLVRLAVTHADGIVLEELAVVKG